MCVYAKQAETQSVHLTLIHLQTPCFLPSHASWLLRATVFHFLELFFHLFVTFISDLVPTRKSPYSQIMEELRMKEVDL